MAAVLGEIRMFAGTYAPLHWVFCNGQIVAITSNTALYSLLETTYGGDGRSTFGYPDMRSRIPMGDGTGPGLTPRIQGYRFGLEEIPLTTEEIPFHTHSIQASTAPATSSNPDQSYTFGNTSPALVYQDYNPGTMETNMIALPTECLENAGGNQPHDNIMPCLGINFIMCVAGIYPSRS